MSQKSLQLARDWLSEAEANFEAEAYRSALSSAYLAVFHSARAYVENDELEEEWPMLFDRIRSIRHADQYSFQAKPTDEEVVSGLHLADSFINRMELLLRETERRE